MYVIINLFVKLSDRICLIRKIKKGKNIPKGKANCRNHLKPNSLVKHYDDHIKFKKIKESLVWVNCE